MDKETIKNKLFAGKQHLEQLLGRFAKKHRHEGTHYDVVAPEYADREDMEDQAEFVEELTNLQAVKEELTDRLSGIVRALEKLEQGTYGTCERCGKPIEEERLTANLAARYCGACIKK